MYLEDYLDYKDNLNEFKFTNKTVDGRSNRTDNYVSVVQLTRNGEFITAWDSIKKAFSSLGKERTAHITSCCRNERKTAYDYKWMYLSDYEKMIKEQNKIS